MVGVMREESRGEYGGVSARRHSTIVTRFARQQERHRCAAMLLAVKCWQNICGGLQQAREEDGAYARAVASRPYRQMRE